MISRVITGGQTGADQGALRAARACGIPTGGYAPTGWLTEDGAAPWLADYGLVETGAPDYPFRTRLNVRAANACVWFGNPHSPGGRLTLRLCHETNIDTFVVISQSTPEDVAEWFACMVADGKSGPLALMVAGNRESKSPGIGATAEAFMRKVFARLGAEGGGG